MSVKHIAFTAYPVKDMARAREFYERDLGLTLGKDFSGKWVEYYPGETGCFAISTMFKGKGFGISFEVDDVDALFAALKAKGVKAGAEPFSSPVCRMAYVSDPDGNSVGLHQKTK
jgi:predicted enzyme related to lactoylglutathione lyase